MLKLIIYQDTLLNQMIFILVMHVKHRNNQREIFKAKVGSRPSKLAKHLHDVHGFKFEKPK